MLLNEGRDRVLPPQILLPGADRDGARFVIAHAIFSGRENDAIESARKFVPLRQKADEGLDVPHLQEVAIAVPRSLTLD
jgi:hypothetical protein